MEKVTLKNVDAVLAVFEKANMVYFADSKTYIYAYDRDDLYREYYVKDLSLAQLIYSKYILETTLFKVSENKYIRPTTKLLNFTVDSFGSLVIGIGCFRLETIKVGENIRETKADVKKWRDILVDHKTELDALLANVHNRTNNYDTIYSMVEAGK